MKNYKKIIYASSILSLLFVVGCSQQVGGELNPGGNIVPPINNEDGSHGDVSVKYSEGDLERTLDTSIWTVGSGNESIQLTDLVENKLLYTSPTSYTSKTGSYMMHDGKLELFIGTTGGDEPDLTFIIKKISSDKNSFVVDKKSKHGNIDNPSNVTFRLDSPCASPTVFPKLPTTLDDETKKVLFDSFYNAGKLMSNNSNSESRLISKESFDELDKKYSLTLGASLLFGYKIDEGLNSCPHKGDDTTKSILYAKVPNSSLDFSYNEVKIDNYDVVLGETPGTYTIIIKDDNNVKEITRDIYAQKVCVREKSDFKHTYLYYFNFGNMESLVD